MPKKLSKLAKRYGVEHTVDYDGLDELCRTDAIDAVYIATPNHTHRALVERIAPHGVHVLVEKPMAVTEDDCEAMIRVCAENQCKLMVAYRLHFEGANLSAIELVKQGQARRAALLLTSTFSFQVAVAQHPRQPARAGRRAALRHRRLLHQRRALPLSRRADRSRRAAGARRRRALRQRRGAGVGDPALPRRAAGAVHRRLRRRSRPASTRSSATKGTLRVDPAYEYRGSLALELTVGDKKPKRKKFKAHDQIGPEIEYFSECILEGHDPEPSGREGLADVRVIRAIYRSIDERRPVALGAFDKSERPAKEQERSAPPQRGEAPTVNVRPES